LILSNGPLFILINIIVREYVGITNYNDKLIIN